MNQNKIKHLEMIEAVIERMAKNSFQLKGWAMTLVAAVGALASQGTDKHYIIMVVIVIIGFWLLDAYYVMQERKYRLLYNNVTDKQENEIDFKMDTRNISGNTKELKYYKCIFSPSVICVYPVIGLAMVAFEIAQKFV